ncbi:MAG: hypothetical protein JWM59_994 [Verrucomicrobiales bacterium]|nr:hypothetical protein [Verrucomicrobiales bacterium]
MKASPWTVLPAFAVLAAATAALTAQAQPQTPEQGKPSSGAKPPVHKAAESALSRVQQDERAKKALEESAALLKESVRKGRAAAEEARRINKDQAKTDPEKTARSLKDKVSPQDTAAVKEQLKKTVKTVLNNDEAKKLIEDTKKSAAAAVDEAAQKNKASKPGTPSSTPLPPPTTFDKIPGPAPAGAATLPTPPKRTATSMASGDRIVAPPAMDPKRPGQPIRPDDPLGRTYVITGNAQIKMPVMQVDADQIIFLQSVDHAGSGLLPGGGSPPAKPQAAGGGQGKKDSNGLESMVATGRVRVVRLDPAKGKEYHGKGNRMVYDQKTGATTITGWPSLQQDNQLITAKQEDAVIVLYSNDQKPTFDNCNVRILSDPKSESGNGQSPQKSTSAASPEATVEDAAPSGNASEAPAPSASPDPRRPAPAGPPRRPAGAAR